MKQNDYHITNLKSFLGREIPMYSIVAFSKEADITNTPSFEKNAYVLYDTMLGNTISRILNNMPDILTQEDVDRLQKELFAVTHASELVKNQHIERIMTRRMNNA